MGKRKLFLFVRFQEATEERYVFVSRVPRILVGALLFLIIGLVLIAVLFGNADGGGWSAGQLTIIIFVCLVLVASIFLVPFTEMFIFDQPKKDFLWRRETLASKLGMAKPQESFYLWRNLRFSWRQIPRTNRLTITTPANDTYVLSFLVKRELIQDFDNWLIGPRKEEEQPEGEFVPLSNEEKTSQQYQSMLSEIKSWGRTLLVFGVIHLIASGLLNPSWGVTLLIVGLFSFIFKDAAIFVLYAVTLVWVGINNIVYSELSYWTFFGFLQIYWGYGVYKKFRQYQMVEQEHLSAADETGGAESKPSRSARFFPGVGCALSTLGLVSFVGLVVLIIVLVALQPVSAEPAEVSWTTEFIFGLLVGMGGLGFGVSLSALLSGYRPKWLAWGGVIAGGLVVLLEFGMFILGSV